MRTGVSRKHLTHSAFITLSHSSRVSCSIQQDHYDIDVLLCVSTSNGFALTAYYLINIMAG